MAGHTLNIDELMNNIREEVRRQRDWDTTIAGMIKPLGEDWPAMDSKAIDEAIASAEMFHGVGTSLPPMTRQRGMQRKVAMLFARLFLRVAQVITRDQRTFNQSSLTALRTIRVNLNTLEQRLAAVREVQTLSVQALAAVWEEQARSVRALETVREEQTKRVLALGQGLVALRDEMSRRGNTFEQEIKAVRADLVTRAEALEQGLAALRLGPCTFDEAPSRRAQLGARDACQDTSAVISYAQNREDMLLRRLFPDRKTGFYIDVGAYDPVEHSVTKYFYDRGWHGVNIEPVLESFQRLCAGRARDINLDCGLLNREAVLTFYESSRDLGLSTFSPTQMESHRQAGLPFIERQRPVTTLANVCEQYVRGEIDFISIDVEGHEREVLEGGDWKRWRPRVVVIAATRPYTNSPVHELWEPLLLTANYLFATFDGINRYYVRAEDRHLLTVLGPPVNVFDRYVPYEFLSKIEKLTARIAAYEKKA